MDWEAQGEIKDSLEEVGEGDQTAAVVATLDGPVDSRPTALLLLVTALWAPRPCFSSSACQILMTHTMTLRRKWSWQHREEVRRQEIGDDIIQRINTWKNTFPPPSSSSSCLRVLPPSTRYVKVARHQLSSASRIVVSQNVAYFSRQAKIIEPAMKGEDTIVRKQSWVETPADSGPISLPCSGPACVPACLPELG